MSNPTLSFLFYKQYTSKVVFIIIIHLLIKLLAMVKNYNFSTV